MHGDEAIAYRAVITTTTPADPESEYESERTERSYTSYAGKYGTPGAARAAITRARREARWRASWRKEPDVVTGHVERSRSPGSESTSNARGGGRHDGGRPLRASPNGDAVFGEIAETTVVGPPTFIRLGRKV